MQRITTLNSMSVPSYTLSGCQRGRTLWLWISIGALFGMLCVLVVFAPARWLAHYAANATQDRLHLMAPKGTVWDGSVQVKLGAGKGASDEAVLPGRVHWNIRPSSKGLRISLDAECCLTQPWIGWLQFSVTGLRLELSDLPEQQPSILPSALLSGLGTPWNTLQLQGSLSLSTRNLSFAQGSQGWIMAGQAQLDATDISTSLSTLKPVGSYRFTLHGGNEPYLHLSTLRGSLQLQGTGRWVQHRLQFTGEASAEPARADALANLLNIIGRRDGERVIIQIG
jgi:general secretion pathway protein N